MIFDATFTISGLQTREEEYYVRALLEHIKMMIKKELDNAPDDIVETYSDIDLACKKVSE